MLVHHNICNQDCSFVQSKVPSERMSLKGSHRPSPLIKPLLPLGGWHEESGKVP